MPESLEEAVMFRSEDYPSFNYIIYLFDKLTSYASTKHSLFLSKRDLQSIGWTGSHVQREVLGL